MNDILSEYRNLLSDEERKEMDNDILKLKKLQSSNPEEFKRQQLELDEKIQKLNIYEKIEKANENIYDIINENSDLIKETPKNNTNNNEIEKLLKMNNREKMAYFDSLNKKEKELELETLRNKKMPLSNTILTFVFLLIIGYFIFGR